MTEAEVDLDGNVLLTVNETAALLRIGRHTLMDFIDQNWGPPAINLAPPGRRKRVLRFDRVQVLRWVEMQRLWTAAA